MLLKLLWLAADAVAAVAIAFVGAVAMAGAAAIGFSQIFPMRCLVPG